VLGVGLGENMSKMGLMRKSRKERKRMREKRQDLRERMIKIRTNSKVEKKWTKMHPTNFCLKISTPPFFPSIFSIRPLERMLPPDQQP